jgi:23S rRNA (pseudouridine1915-N3)-methyltransferase
MKLHIVTIGAPKQIYAKAGWELYIARLGHYHQVRVTNIADKHNDSAHILAAAGKSYKVAMEVRGRALSSPALAKFLAERELESREVSFIIGGPNGLPIEIVEAADYQLSLSALTLPHDLAMVVLLEALYRASSINAGQPYHK